MPDDLKAWMPDVAERLLGKPSHQSRSERRYGTHGSLSVDLNKGTWFSHEENTGGGVIDLVVRVRGGSKQDAAEWLSAEFGIEFSERAEKSLTKPKLNGQGGHAAHVVASYVYRDPEGEPRYRIVRLEPKSFRQERYDPSSGKFVGGRGCMAGVDLLPYRIDEWLPEQNAPLLVPEGEKDVDRLFELGFFATCNPGGTGKWNQEWTPWFEGREVIVLPDNDPYQAGDLQQQGKGRRHAADIAQSLRGVAASVRVLELPGLPPKGDVSDWLDAGNLPEELEQLVRSAPLVDDVILERLKEGRPPLQPFDYIDHADLGETIPPREFIIENWLPVGTVTSLYGSGGTGKSFLAIMMGMCIAAGREWLGFGAKQAVVMAVMCEDDELELKRRRNKIARALAITRDDIEGRLYLSSRVGAPNTLMDFPAGVPRRTELLDQIVSEAKRLGARLVILDNAGQLFAGNENDRGQVTAFLNAISHVAVQIKGAVLLLGHPPKAEGVQYSGSTAWDAVVRSRIWFERQVPKDEGEDADAETRYVLHRQKANYAPKEKLELVLDPVTEVVVRADQYVETSSTQDHKRRRLGEARQHILDTLDDLVARNEATSQSPRHRNYLVRVMKEDGLCKGFGEVVLKKALESLIDEGAVTTDAVVGRYANRTPRYGLARTRSMGRG